MFLEDGLNILVSVRGLRTGRAFSQLWKTGDKCHIPKSGISRQDLSMRKSRQLNLNMPSCAFFSGVEEPGEIVTHFHPRTLSKGLSEREFAERRPPVNHVEKLGESLGKLLDLAFLSILVFSATTFVL